MRRLATALSGLAFLSACAAAAYLLTAPVYQGIQTSTTTGLGGASGQQLSQTLVEVNGPSVIGLLVLVAVLAGIPLLAGLRSPAVQRPATWSCALLLLAFSVISGFSVGLLFLPTAGLLLLSAVATVFMTVPDGPMEIGRRGAL